MHFWSGLLFMLICLMQHNVSHATPGNFLGDQEDICTEVFFRQGYAVAYDDDLEKETREFNPASSDNLKEELTHFGPVTLNLMDQHVADEILDGFLPYAPWIYGLILDNNFFTNKALSRLAEFTELRYLDLSGNNFTSLKSLESLEHLSRLTIAYNNGIDSSEVMNLKAAKPNLMIER